MLPTWDVARWLSWPISRDRWLDRFEGRVFQIWQDEMGFSQLSRDGWVGAGPLILDVFAARMPNPGFSAVTHRAP